MTQHQGFDPETISEIIEMALSDKTASTISEPSTGLVRTRFGP